MDRLDLAQVLKILASPDKIAVMRAVKSVGRASAKNVLTVAQEERPITPDRVNNSLYRLTELGLVTRVERDDSGKHADWQYNATGCDELIRRMRDVF